MDAYRALGLFRFYCLDFVRVGFSSFFFVCERFSGSSSLRLFRSSILLFRNDERRLSVFPYLDL